MLGGISNECAISVSEFPVAWKIKVVKDSQYRKCEYVRYDLDLLLYPWAAKNPMIQAYSGGRPT